MSWVAARPRPTSPFKSFRSPPPTVTMTCAPLPATGSAPLAAAVVPVTAKSAAFAPRTTSLKVTRNTSVSAFVSAASALVPSWRSIATTVGAVLSIR